MHECVAAILRRDGRVLLCHRAPDREWYPNVWDLPGGHVEADETAASALARELDEELGIEIAPPECAPWLTVDDVALGLHLDVWVIDSWSGTPVNRAPHEHDRIEWFAADELTDLPLADGLSLPWLRDALHASPLR